MTGQVKGTRMSSMQLFRSKTHNWELQALFSVLLFETLGTTSKPASKTSIGMMFYYEVFKK